MTAKERAGLLAMAEFYAYDNIRRALVYAGYGSFPFATRDELESIYLAVKDEPLAPTCGGTGSARREGT